MAQKDRFVLPRVSSMLTTPTRSRMSKSGGETGLCDIRPVQEEKDEKDEEEGKEKDDEEEVDSSAVS